jgi:hypothetical protein
VQSYSLLWPNKIVSECPCGVEATSGTSFRNDCVLLRCNGPIKECHLRTSNLNPYEKAIVRNAEWFISWQSREGFIDTEGDEFCGIRGDATLVGHSVTVRCYANALTASAKYPGSARLCLDWLAARQDSRGGWRGFSAFTLDGAQCVFEGFNTYQKITGEQRYETVLVKAADRMLRGTLDSEGRLRLSNVIEIGEYAPFALLAWKTTGEIHFKQAAECILAHIERNFDEKEGAWRPFDITKVRSDFFARLLRPPLRFAMQHFPVRGKTHVKFPEHLLPFMVIDRHPQYSLNLTDAEALIDTLDGSCDFPRLKEQARAAIAWTEFHCRRPFRGSLVESRKMDGRPIVYPVPIINDTRVAARWPATSLLIAYCGVNDPNYRARARGVADWILSVPDSNGGFSNFQNPDGSMKPLQSGNANFYSSMALWLFNKVYNVGRIEIFTAA